MIRPITCPDCKKQIASFDDHTGNLANEDLPAHIKAWGVRLHCFDCGKGFRWNGQQVASKLKQKRNLPDSKLVIANAAALG